MATLTIAKADRPAVAAQLRVQIQHIQAVYNLVAAITIHPPAETLGERDGRRFDDEQRAPTTKPRAQSTVDAAVTSQERRQGQIRVSSTDTTRNCDGDHQRLIASCRTVSTFVLNIYVGPRRDRTKSQAVLRSIDDRRETKEKTVDVKQNPEL